MRKRRFGRSANDDEPLNPFRGERLFAACGTTQPSLSSPPCLTLNELERKMAEIDKELRARSPICVELRLNQGGLDALKEVCFETNGRASIHGLPVKLSAEIPDGQPMYELVYRFALKVHERSEGEE